MPKWTFDKELEDTAKSAATGFSIADKAKKEKAETPSPSPAPVQDADKIDQNGFMSGMRYKRGGYVPARPSGKRMYAKGGMVKGCR